MSLFEGKCPVEGKCPGSENSKKKAPFNQKADRYVVYVANALGSVWVLGTNLALLSLWLILGPFFRFSTVWQLSVTTAMSVITYLTIFIIQNTQNRDAKATHLKLDELIRSLDSARNRMVNLQDLTKEELDALQTEFENLRSRAMRGEIHPTAVVSTENASTDINPPR